MHKIALILAGCGQTDGSEIQQTVLTLLALAQEGIYWEAFAPNISQARVYDHFHKKNEEDLRNVLIESARIMRGKIKPLTEVVATEYAGVIIPGGFGSISNLCNYAEKGNDFTLQADFESFISTLVKLKKPCAFISVASIMIPRIFPNKNPKFTVGNDQNIALQMKQLGVSNINCLATEVIVDKTNKILSTPGHMGAKNIMEVYEGIHKLVRELKNLTIV